MLSKLGQAVTELDSWIVKLLQAATCIEARFFLVRVERKRLRIRVLARRHPDVTPCDQFLAAPNRSRVHHHLLLCAIWLGRSPALRSARLRWSTEHTVEALDIDSRAITPCRCELSAATPFPFMELELERGAVSVLDRMFRRASFLDELRRLEKVSFLAPMTVILDERVLHQGSYEPRTQNRGLNDSPGSTGLEPFSYPSRLLPLWDEERRKRLKLLVSMKKGRPRATAYAEFLPESSKSQIHWLLDGATIQVDELPYEKGRDGLLVFLSAEGLDTDISTLALALSPALELRRCDRALWDWCTGSLGFRSGEGAETT